MDPFTFWISLLLRPKTETKLLNFGLSLELRLTNNCSAHHHSIMLPLTSSLMYPYFLFMNQRKSEVIFIHQNLISNWLTYLGHAKSTDEIISFGVSDRLVRSLVSAKRSANRWVQTKKRLHVLADFWSQSEFRTQQKSQQKTNPNSEMTSVMVECYVCLSLVWLSTETL